METATFEHPPQDWPSATIPDTLNGGTRKSLISSDMHATIAPMVERALALQAAAKEASDRYKAAQSYLKEWMQDNGHACIECKAWRVSLSESEGRESLDKDAMRAAGIDLARFTSTGAPYKILKITARKAR